MLGPCFALRQNIARMSIFWEHDLAAKVNIPRDWVLVFRVATVDRRKFLNCQISVAPDRIVISSTLLRTAGGVLGKMGTAERIQAAQRAAQRFYV